MTQHKHTAPTPKAETPPPSPKKLYIRTVSGELLHLFTNVTFTTDPKKVEVDGFVQAQLDARKLVVADE